MCVEHWFLRISTDWLTPGEALVGFQSTSFPEMGIIGMALPFQDKLQDN